MTNIEVHKTKQGGNAVYFFGFIGSLIYYFHQADTFFQSLGAILKAIVWPAFVVYDILQYIHH